VVEITTFYDFVTECAISSSSLTKQPFLSHSLPEKILPDCHPVFASLEFSTIFFLTEQGRQP
jgi:hypothetical protein